LICAARLVTTEDRLAKPPWIRLLRPPMIAPILPGRLSNGVTKAVAAWSAEPASIVPSASLTPVAASCAAGAILLTSVTMPSTAEDAALWVDRSRDRGNAVGDFAGDVLDVAGRRGRTGGDAVERGLRLVGAVRDAIDDVEDFLRQLPARAAAAKHGDLVVEVWTLVAVSSTAAPSRFGIGRGLNRRCAVAGNAASRLRRCKLRIGHLARKQAR
jgi:hypothetical protein